MSTRQTNVLNRSSPSHPFPLYETTIVLIVDFFHSSATLPSSKNPLTRLTPPLRLNSFRSAVLPSRPGVVPLWSFISEGYFLPSAPYFRLMTFEHVKETGCWGLRQLAHSHYAKSRVNFALGDACVYHVARVLLGRTRCY